MVLSMMVIGKKISNMDKVSRHGLMVPSMKVTTFMERRTVKVNSPGLTVLLIMDPSKTTTFKAAELIIGLMEENSMDHG